MNQPAEIHQHENSSSFCLPTVDDMRQSLLKLISAEEEKAVMSSGQRRKRARHFNSPQYADWGWQQMADFLAGGCASFRCAVSSSSTSVDSADMKEELGMKRDGGDVGCDLKSAHHSSPSSSYFVADIHGIHGIHHDVGCVNPQMVVEGEKQRRKTPAGNRGFSRAVLDALSAAYERSPYLSRSERDKLAKQLGLTSKQVMVWFNNRRNKRKAAPAPVSVTELPVVAQSSSEVTAP